MRVRVIRLIPVGDARLACANREPFIGPHPLCEVETGKYMAAFNAAVERGEYDTRGFTPSEAKALQKERGK